MLLCETGITCGAVTETVVVMLFTQISRRGSIRGRSKKVFFSLKCADWFWGPLPPPNPPSLVVSGYRGRYPRSVKLPGRQTDLKPLSNAM